MEERRRATDIEFEELKKEVIELKIAVSDLVDAWKAAKGILALVKWAAGLGAAITMILAYFHGDGPK